MLQYLATLLFTVRGAAEIIDAQLLTSRNAAARAHIAPLGRGGIARHIAVGLWVMVHGRSDRVDGHPLRQDLVRVLTAAGLRLDRHGVHPDQAHQSAQPLRPHQQSCGRLAGAGENEGKPLLGPGEGPKITRLHKHKGSTNDGVLP